MATQRSGVADGGEGAEEEGFDAGGMWASVGGEATADGEQEHADGDGGDEEDTDGGVFGDAFTSGDVAHEHGGAEAEDAGDDLAGDVIVESGEVVADEDGDGDAAEAGVGDAFGNQGHAAEDDVDGEQRAGGSDDGAGDEEVAGEVEHRAVVDGGEKGVGHWGSGKGIDHCAIFIIHCSLTEMHNE